MKEIIKIYKRPSGKTGWKIDGNNYTYSNKKLLEILEHNKILKNDCLIKFEGINECGFIGLSIDIINIIENKLFSLEEACEFMKARIDQKKINVKINLEYK